MKFPRKMPKKLPAPATGTGRVRRAAERAFLLAGADLVATGTVVRMAYARKVRPVPHDYQSAHRALERIAVRVKRSPTGSGAAWLWRKRNSDGNDNTPTPARQT